MANFCTGCGSPVQAGAGFCNQCGLAVANVAPAAAAPANTPTPAPSGTSTFVKVLLIFIAAILLIGAIGVAGVVYVGYRVKTKAEQVARDYGLDARSSAPMARRLDPCSLLTRSEASGILGTPIERMESQGSSTCQYWAKAPSDEERQQQIADAQRKLERNSSPENTQPVEQMVKAMGGMATGTGPYFSITVDWNGGRAALVATKLVSAVGGGNMKAIERISGVGDEAVLGPLASTLVFVKGTTSVQIDLRMVPNGRDCGIAIGKIVASRLHV